MKSFVCLLLLWAISIPQAQNVIDNPEFKFRKTIHLLADNHEELENYNISSEKQGSQALSFDKISGNWMGMDDYYEWAFGIYDSLAIVSNRFYRYENIRKKGKSMLLALVGDDGEKLKLKFTLQNNGLCRIKKNEEPARLFSRDAKSMKAFRPDRDNERVFRHDSVCVQGYIAGYDRKLGFSNGMIFVYNCLTREDCPVVVNVQPNGRFEGRFMLNYPVFTTVIFHGNPIPFYVEPGEKVTIYLDWESVVARGRVPDINYPINNLHYMGNTAHISCAMNYVDNLYKLPFHRLFDFQKKFTPVQFVEHFEPVFRGWAEKSDSLINVNLYSGKTTRMVRNAAKVLQGNFLLAFVMERDYLARDYKEFPAMQVKETKDYYKFLQQMPLNDSLIVADKNFSDFLNQLESLNFARAMGDTTTYEPGMVSMTFPEKSILAYLKDHGVKLTPEEESLEKNDLKRAGKEVSMKLGLLFEESRIRSELREKYKDLAEAFEKENNPDYSATKIEMSADDIARENAEIFYDRQKVKLGLIDTVVGHSSLVAQIISLRNFMSELELKDRMTARYMLEAEKRLIDNSFIQSESERVYAKAFPMLHEGTYALPEGRATEIFRDIIKAHAGKVLFLDFWATTCAPCRGAIERSADLRKQYRNHPDFQFIYITGDRESPEKAYNEYVEKNLKDEACYRIPQSDYNLLRQLFHFNAIPHYELIEKDGTVYQDVPKAYDVKEFLMKRFGSE